MDHKQIIAKLINLGLTHEQACFALGVVLDERMNADREGYIRGFNSGYEYAELQLKKAKP